MSPKDSQAYNAKKEILLRSLQEPASSGCLSLYKTTSNLFRSIDRSKKSSSIDVRSFTSIIAIDTRKLIAEVEGMATYEDLVRQTLRHGLLPAVVPQLKSITVGGAYAGGGIESSSFRFGLMHDTVTEADVLIGDGSVITCSNHNEHNDLFTAFPNTYGSLGYALKLKLKLVPALPFVKLRHHRFSSIPEFFTAMSLLCRSTNDLAAPAFIDGVIFSKNEMYMTVGEFSDAAPYVSDYTYDKIYYKSIRERSEDYLTTHDYIWRWDADWFWCSKVFGMQNIFLRKLLGKFMLSSAAYAKIMHALDKSRLWRFYKNFLSGPKEPIIQDILIPDENAGVFFDFLDKEIGILPIWICPAFSSRHFDFCPLRTHSLYFDFGFWDSVVTSHPPGYFNRKIEKKTAQLQGFKSLYSDSYYTSEEFWSIYNYFLFEKLKAKYDAPGRFKSLYQKVCASS